MSTFSTAFAMPAVVRAFVLCSLLCLNFAQAQERGTISGSVVESKKGEPLPGAVVTIIGSQLGTVARVDGSFEIKQVKPGSYDVRASLVGYSVAKQRVTVEAGGAAKADFRLAENLVGTDEVVALGTRGAERTVTNTPVPIDVMTAQDIRNSGLTETNQIIQMLAPSFNFPRPSVADGTDHVRPATLRGLGPDQVLVLVNGKRRHNSALVNVNGTIGRGATGVDLNAIPSNAIERIEILRDGASAQYGSDAIAGVINIVLKSGMTPGLSTLAGMNNTEFNGFRANDGGVAQVDGDYGFRINDDGYLHVSGAFRNRNATNRSLVDTRQQYFTGDARNNDVNLTRQRNHIQGDAKTLDAGVFLNGGLPFGEGMTAYLNGGYNYRNGTAAGFYRRALDDRTVRAIYPNGFLPKIESRIKDLSVNGGVKGSFGDWLWDASSVYGRNKFDFYVRQSANASMGAASPTSFYCGALVFGQSTTNIDLSSTFDVGTASPLTLALGGELRLDQYKIQAGDPASYIDGGVPIDTSVGRTNKKAAIGAQVFPGFRPSNAVNESRRGLSFYADLETKVIEQILLSAAGRFENYSDFGSTFNVKVATRIEPIEHYGIRGAFSTGFRAPSLQQEFFSSTATNFLNVSGVLQPFDVVTYPATSPEAQRLGATALKAEKSTNISAGITMKPIENLSITVDYYNIKIKDRIVFSENFTGAQVSALLPAGVNGARFFTNAIDTKTRGVDIIVRAALDFDDAGVLKLFFGANITRTRVDKVIATPSQLTGLSEALFGRVERGRIEVGQPDRTYQANANYSVGLFGAQMRVTRFGEVVNIATLPQNDQVFAPKFITDLEVSYKFAAIFRLALGVNNVGDIYPVQNIPANNNAGIFPYNGISPFGFNGRFIYTKLSTDL